MNQTDRLSWQLQKVLLKTTRGKLTLKWIEKIDRLLNTNFFVSYDMHASELVLLDFSNESYLL